MTRTSDSEPIVVTGLVEALPVAASATTSRSLVDNEEVRVVAFSFDAGEELTEHTAAFPAVVTLLTGAVRFDVAGSSHELSPGDCVYLPAGEPHSLVAQVPSHLSLALLRRRSG